MGGLFLLVKGYFASKRKAGATIGLSEKLLQAAGLRLPDVFPLRQIQVATRKKLTDRRKRR
jgi:hypothetical protein